MDSFTCTDEFSYNEECESNSDSQSESLSDKKGKTEKLTRELNFAFSDLSKNEFIVTPKGIAKIIQPFKENEKEFGKSKFKVEIDGKSEVITIDQMSYSVYKPIKIYVVNYQNRMFQLTQCVDINFTFGQFKEEFCNIYKISPKTIALIYKNNKLKEKDMSKKLGKDFDYENEHLIILQGNPIIRKSTFSDLSLCPWSQREWIDVKYIFLVNTHIHCSNIYFYKSYYQGCRAEYCQMEISEVDDNIQTYLSEGEVKTGKKKSKENDASSYNFDKIFKNPDNIKFTKLKTVDSLNAENVYTNDRDGDDDNSDEDSMYSVKQGIEEINKKMVSVELGNDLVPNKIYYVKFRLNTYYDTINSYNFKHERVKKSKLKDRLEVTFYMPPPADQNYNSLFIGGLEYRVKTIFDS